MAVLTSDQIRIYKAMPPLVRHELPALGGDVFYEGAAVGDNGSGIARPLVAGDPFLGLVEVHLDTSGLSNSDRDVRLNASGAGRLSVVGVTGPGDVGTSVYASDDGTFTLTPTANSLVGKVIRHVAGTDVEVKFESVSARSL